MRSSLLLAVAPWLWLITISVSSFTLLFTSPMAFTRFEIFSIRFWSCGQQTAEAVSGLPLARSWDESGRELDGHDFSSVWPSPAESLPLRDRSSVQEAVYHHVSPFLLSCQSPGSRGGPRSPQEFLDSWLWSCAVLALPVSVS